MKKIFRLFMVALMAVALCSCNEDKPDNGPKPGPVGGAGEVVEATMENMHGEWKLTAWSGSVGFPDDQHTVYLRLDKSGSFALYQININNAGVEVYNGTFALNGRTITGNYSDGAAWASDYNLEEIRQNQMIWQVGSTGEKSTYFRTQIPEDVLNRAEAGETVRSIDAIRFL